MAVKNSRAGLRQKGDTLIHNGMLCTQFFLWLFWRKEQETLKLTDRTILNWTRQYLAYPDYVVTFWWPVRATEELPAQIRAKQWGLD